MKTASSVRAPASRTGSRGEKRDALAAARPTGARAKNPPSGTITRFPRHPFGTTVGSMRSPHIFEPGSETQSPSKTDQLSFGFTIDGQAEKQPWTVRGGPRENCACGGESSPKTWTFGTGRTGRPALGCREANRRRSSWSPGCYQEIARRLARLREPDRRAVTLRRGHHSIERGAYIKPLTQNVQRGCRTPCFVRHLRRQQRCAAHRRMRRTHGRDRTWRRVRWCEESVISSSSGLAKRIERRSLEPLAATRTTEPRTLKANTRFSPTAFHVIAFSPLHAALLDLEDVHSAASLTDNDEPAIE